jgi:hypothetical protein
LKTKGESSVWWPASMNAFCASGCIGVERILMRQRLADPRRVHDAGVRLRAQYQVRI